MLILLTEYQAKGDKQWVFQRNFFYFGMRETDECDVEVVICPKHHWDTDHCLSDKYFEYDLPDYFGEPDCENTWFLEESSANIKVDLENLGFTHNPDIDNFLIEIASEEYDD